MAEPRLSELRAIVERIETGNSAPGSISCKHFFSTAAAWVDGRIFMSLSPAGLALKLPEADCAALFAGGGTPLRYFPKAPVKKGYAVPPRQLAADEKALADWIRRAIEFAK